MNEEHLETDELTDASWLEIQITTPPNRGKSSAVVVNRDVVEEELNYINRKARTHTYDAESLSKEASNLDERLNTLGLTNNKEREGATAILISGTDVKDAYLRASKGKMPQRTKVELRRDKKGWIITSIAKGEYYPGAEVILTLEQQLICETVAVGKFNALKTIR